VNKLLQLWEVLRSSLWFIPSLIVLGTVVLAVALIETDSYGNRESLSEEWPRLFGAGAANIYDAEFARVQVRIFEEDLRHSRRITLEEWENRPWRDKVLDALAGLFSSQL